MEPPITVNLLNGDAIRHVQITTLVKVNDSDIEDELEYHHGAIRHAMVMLFSDRDIKEMSSVKGKEALRQKTLTTI